MHEHARTERTHRTGSARRGFVSSNALSFEVLSDALTVLTLEIAVVLTGRDLPQATLAHQRLVSYSRVAGPSCHWPTLRAAYSAHSLAHASEQRGYIVPSGKRPAGSAQTAQSIETRALAFDGSGIHSHPRHEPEVDADMLRVAGIRAEPDPSTTGAVPPRREPVKSSCHWSTLLWSQSRAASAVTWMWSAAQTRGLPSRRHSRTSNGLPGDRDAHPHRAAVWSEWLHPVPRPVATRCAALGAPLAQVRGGARVHW